MTAMTETAEATLATTNETDTNETDTDSLVTVDAGAGHTEVIS